MRKSLLASVLGLVLTLALSTTAFAAPSTQTISVYFSYVTFSSILGGQISGNASVSGDLSDAGLSGLRGIANLPLRDSKLWIEPTGAFVLNTEQMNVQWNRYTCDPFVGCTYEYGYSTFERTSGAGPVDIRLGQLRGTGTLSLATNSACVASCPPPGSYWYAPTGYANLNGAVIGNSDAGTLWMSGGAPTIQ
ncbi:MAG TPA: hypothetical protein VGR85_15000 [Candidatus Limnocylindria bacterium]|jgi:hypothetical protein|nr:hypothetical protein [Candidatus Limnocylindria bacterium]